MVARIHQLWRDGSRDTQIADTLSREGFRSARRAQVSAATVVKIRKHPQWISRYQQQRGTDRAETLDYALLLSGECDLELDSGEIVHMKPGDIAVQRGTMHAWVNNGTAPAVFAFILVDADPAKVAGRELNTHFPAP